MKTLKAAGSLLLLSAIFITPANANWFSSQSSNTMYMSAPYEIRRRPNCARCIAKTVPSPRLPFRAARRPSLLRQMTRAI